MNKSTGGDMDEIMQLREAVEGMESRHDALMERLIDAMRKQADNSSNSTITFNAGGIGVWLAASACAVMLGVNMVLIVILADHSRKIDDLGDYIHAIYMAAPSLKSVETPHEAR